MSKSEAPAAEPVKDLAGREIKGGDSIVYPVRRGSSMWMAKLRVSGVSGGSSPSIQGYNDVGRRITIHNVQNVVVLVPLETSAT